LLAAGLVLAAALAATPARAMELNLGATLGAGAPLTQVMRRAKPGLAFAMEATYGPLAYLEFGLRYSLGWFPQEERDAAGILKNPVFDHGICPLLRFSLFGSSRSGWLDADGWLRSSFWLEVAPGYHMIGRESAFGLEAGFGYEFRPRRRLFFSPLVRFTSDFGTSQGTAAYVVLALAVGYDFGGLIGGDEDEAEAAATQQQQQQRPNPDYPTQLAPSGGTTWP
jgi:hypothetical protein